jgi:hypothetical protein
MIGSTNTILSFILQTSGEDVEGGRESLYSRTSEGC